MSERGVFAVDRGLWSDPDFADEPFSEREAFLWLLSEAAWRPTSVRIGHHRVELDRGQCAFSTRFMAEKWKWSEARVRRYLARLISAEIICTRANKIATHVMIRNYDKFQRVSLPDAETATHVRRTSDAPETHLRRKEEDRETRETNTPTDAIASSAPKGARTTRKPRNRALPVDWHPGDRSERVRAELGRSAEWMHRTAAAMRTWAESKGEIRADWDATHDGWMRREAERERERGSGYPQSRAGPDRKPSSNGALSRVADLLGVPDDQRSNPPSTFRDHGAYIDHEGDGRHDREVHEPLGGQAGGFSTQAALRLVGSGRH
ncbi:hypothetical protein [Methylorubrum extorquens]